MPSSNSRGRGNLNPSNFRCIEADATKYLASWQARVHRNAARHSEPLRCHRSAPCGEPSFAVRSAVASTPLDVRHCNRRPLRPRAVREWELQAVRPTWSAAAGEVGRGHDWSSSGFLCQGAEPRRRSETCQVAGSPANAEWGSSRCTNIMRVRVAQPRGQSQDGNAGTGRVRHRAPRNPPLGVVGQHTLALPNVPAIVAASFRGGMTAATPCGRRVARSKAPA